MIFTVVVSWPVRAVVSVVSGWEAMAIFVLVHLTGPQVCPPTATRSTTTPAVEDYPFTRTHIKATGEPRPEAADAFWTAADRAKASPAWRYREIATNHMIASNRPEKLTGLLLELA